MWNAATEQARAEGDLAVVGIIQEQHPERARLFAQWQGIDWPILWDPFNTVGDAVVPVYRLIDEHGVLRSSRPSPDDLARFLTTEFEAPAETEPQTAAPTERRSLTESETSSAGDPARPAAEVVAALLFDRRPPTDAELAILNARAGSSPSDRFRLGVALRLRHDSPARTAGDFAAALAAWNAALDGEPGQYIWRRRIQQFGPRLDKPYPFYDWVDAAADEIRARGERPIDLPVRLTGSERASRGDFEAASGAVEPDPAGAVPRDSDGLFTVDSAVAFDTGNERAVARLHLWFAPAPGSGGHWNNESGPARVWLDAASLPDGWSLERPLTDLPGPDAATSNETRGFDLELRAPADFAGEATLSGYLVTDACRDDFVCFHVRHDFTVTVER